MNEPSNTPLYEPPLSTPPLNEPPLGEPEPFYQVWLKALTKPNEQTYVEIANSAGASPKKAYIWLAISYVVAFFVSVLVIQISTVMQLGGDVGGALGNSLIALVCGAPIGAVIGLLFYALDVAIVQWVAKMFKGTGSYDKLIYAFAAFTAPLSLVSAAVSIFSVIPFVGLCVSIIGIGIAIYSIVLMVTATKAVNGFGWGEAAGSVLIPGFIILFLCACVTIGLMIALAPVIGDVFSSMSY